MRIPNTLRHTYRTMSSPAPAPWRADFLTHLSKAEPPLLALSTIRPTSPPSPRARTVVFRGMWGDLTPNDRNPAPRNPPVFESDFLTLTTDARMDKAREIAPAPTGGELVGTDGGGRFEAVFWGSEAMTQWRFSGRAYLLGPDVESGDPPAERVREVLQRGMRRVADGDFSWEKEVTAHFGNLSPAMRGTFRNPMPGIAVAEGAGEGLGVGQRVEDLHDGVARENFRVVVLVPDEVDRLDVETARRWRFRDVGGLGGSAWETTEIWP